MKLWIGNEQEGKHKGKQTLFIGDNNITIKDINEVAKYQAFEQLYFGAGICTKINYDTVREAVKLFPEHIITVEVDYSEFNTVREEFVNSRIEFILTITNKGFSKLRNRSRESVQIKVQSLQNKDKFIALGVLKIFDIVDVTQLHTKTYKGDKVLK